MRSLPNPVNVLRPAGFAAERWLLLCTLAGIGFWLLSLRVDGPASSGATAVDVAIGRGLPLLSTDLALESRGISYLDDVQDVTAAVAAGLARVGVDAGPSGVRIVHRPDAVSAVSMFADDLVRVWGSADVQVIIDAWHPRQLALLLAMLVVLNCGALIVLRQLREVHAGEWLRWLVLQGAGVPALIVGLLARQSLQVGMLGLFAFIGLRGLGSLPEVLPLILALSLCAVWLAVLFCVTRRSRYWLWLSVHGAIAAIWFGIGTDSGVGALAILLPASILLILCVASIGLAPRLALWFRGGVP